MQGITATATIFCLTFFIILGLHVLPQNILFVQPIIGCFAFRHSHLNGCPMDRETSNAYLTSLVIIVRFQCIVFRYV